MHAGNGRKGDRSPSRSSWLVAEQRLPEHVSDDRNTTTLTPGGGAAAAASSWPRSQAKIVVSHSANRGVAGEECSRSLRRTGCQDRHRTSKGCWCAELFAYSYTKCPAKGFTHAMTVPCGTVWTNASGRPGITSLCGRTNTSTERTSREGRRRRRRGHRWGSPWAQV
jgi:hypothetical protein